MLFFHNCHLIKNKSHEGKLTMKIFMEEDRQKGRERKVMYSTSLPIGLKVSLEEAATALHRKKADWIRTSINLFLSLPEKEQERLILNTYNQMEKKQLRPFTTTLTESQLISLNTLSKSLKRSKVEIFRAAVFNFLSKSTLEQERVIKKSLSQWGLKLVPVMRVFWKMPPFAQSLCPIQFPIIEIFHIFMRLKFSPSLIRTSIEDFSKVSLNLIGLTGARFLFGNSGKAGKGFKEYLKRINFPLNRLTLSGVGPSRKKLYCSKWRVPAVSALWKPDKRIIKRSCGPVQ